MLFILGRELLFVKSFDSMTDPYGGASASLSLSSSSNSSSNDTDDDQAIARMLAEEENNKNHGKLGKMLSHLDSIPV